MSGGLEVIVRRIRIDQALPIRLAALQPGETLDAVRTEDDADARHFGGFLEGRLLCVASLVLDGQEARFRKFATLPEMQGRGAGTHVLSATIEDARAAGMRLFWCNARVGAISIYQRAGMQPVGARILRQGREYQRMELAL